MGNRWVGGNAPKHPRAKPPVACGTPPLLESLHFASPKAFLVVSFEGISRFIPNTLGHSLLTAENQQVVWVPQGNQHLGSLKGCIWGRHLGGPALEGVGCIFHANSLNKGKRKAGTV